MIAVKVIASFLILFALFTNTFDVKLAGAHHNPGGKLPGIPTWLIQDILWERGEVTWCVDQRASTYPNFLSQQRQVVAADYIATGVPAREIPGVYLTANQALAVGCSVWYTMPDEQMSAGVAGQIWYANRPVQVKINWRLGYFDYRTTIGHEGTNCGHAMGEHEGYDDINFLSHLRTYGFWASPWNSPTVMDFSTGVWECTPADVALIWSWLLPKPLNNFYGIGSDASHTYLYYYRGAAVGQATRIAIMAEPPDKSGYYWTGNHWPVVDGYVELTLVSDSGWCFYANQEIAPWVESWSRPSMRNDILLGCKE